jgi:hypothetical protein
MRVSVVVLALALAAAPALLCPGNAGATDVSGALVASSDCTQHVLDRNDDGSTSAVQLPFQVNFFGRSYNQLWVNNNGNVTFDEPLWTYTPFGLAGTSAVIIAPFFADVDTRGAGSDVVRYGWGETTYQGHHAFCVDWVNVGYYNYHYDKLNSFQLLLVQREDGLPGDFDIVFNYGSIQWETGDASGGSGGMGGSPAHVGYSNGDGQIGTSFELPGSGRTGAFLDGEPNFGLVNHSSKGSPQIGRYTYAVRNGDPPPDQYVAMGDSYQSGVGAGDYYPETNIGGTNECLRSPNAYAPLLVADGTIPFRLDFVACSGARIEHLYQSGPVTNGPPWNEDAQLDHLSDHTALVTVGLGGNNLDFGPLIADCVLKHFIFSSCEDAYDGQVTDALLALYEHPTGLNRLQQVYSDIRFRAPRGRALVFGYPRFFGVEGGSDWWSSGLFVPRCQNIRVSDQLWINHKIDQLDTAIRVSAQSMGLEYVDIENASDGHELCKGDPGFLNGIDLGNRVQSFHPTAYGHGVIAGVLRSALQAGPLSSPFTVGQGQTVTTTTTVNGGPEVTFSSTWPGSDVAMTLRSPSGRVIDRSTTAVDVYHRVGATQELYVVSKPEPGVWTVELYGVKVQAGGERTTLSVFESPRPNVDPVARFTLTPDGRTVGVDAGASTDSDGQVVKYLWEFGDGSFATGATASHTYLEGGTYRVTLTVADDRGGLGFAAANQDLVVPKYEFAGFSSPVEDQPALNSANGGSTVPVKFQVANAGGADVVDHAFPQSQQIDCVTRATVGDTEPTESNAGWVPQPAGSYHYDWKTTKSWAGTCRRLTVGLDDGSRHSADFSFH